MFTPSAPAETWVELQTLAPISRKAETFDVLVRPTTGGLYSRPLRTGPFKPLDGMLFYVAGYVSSTGAAQDGAQPWEIGPLEVGGFTYPGFTLNVKRMAVWLPDAPIRAERLWYVGQHVADTIERSPGPASPDDQRRAADAQEALIKFSDQLSQGRGKKRGDGATWRGGVPDFLDDLWDTLDRYRASTGRHWPVLTGQAGKTFREMMRECPSSKTLGRWLATAKLRPQDIETGKVTRANYREFVSTQGL